jgi:hypothetical protein
MNRFGFVDTDRFADDGRAARDAQEAQLSLEPVARVLAAVLVIALVGRSAPQPGLATRQDSLTLLGDRPGRHPKLGAQDVEILAAQDPQHDLHLPPG